MICIDTTLKHLPIGIEDFEKMRKIRFYYVDKTGMIRELLQNPAEVTLFMRPRRFGKSLNMSMLRYFFEPESDKELFEGLEITYQDMYSSIDNIWSVLFTTGYLTQRGRGEGRSFQLAIPNLEVREIFTRQIMEMFKEDAKQDGEALDDLCRAL